MKGISEMKKVLLLIFLLVSTTISMAGSGKASWYGPNFHGKKTASGEIFNQNAMTAAHNSLPFGTVVKVTYKGKSVNVRINDTGGFGKYGRTFDLSKGAAKAIGCPGVCTVDYEIISKPDRSIPFKNKPKKM